MFFAYGEKKTRENEKCCAPKTACCAARNQPRGGCCAKRLFGPKCCARATAHQLVDALCGPFGGYIPGTCSQSGPKNPKSPQHQGTSCSGRGKSSLKHEKTPLQRLSQDRSAQVTTVFFLLVINRWLFFLPRDRKQNKIFVPVYLDVVFFTQGILRRNSRALGICERGSIFYTRQVDRREYGRIINTSYQKLPFGSGDDPDKLFFCQALN